MSEKTKWEILLLPSYSCVIISTQRLYPPPPVRPPRNVILCVSHSFSYNDSCRLLLPMQKYSHFVCFVCSHLAPVLYTSVSCCFPFFLSLLFKIRNKSINKRARTTHSFIHFSSTKKKNGNCSEKDERGELILIGSEKKENVKELPKWIFLLLLRFPLLSVIIISNRSSSSSDGGG